MSGNMFILQELRPCLCVFFFNDTATTEIYTLSLHDALPISRTRTDSRRRRWGRDRRLDSGAASPDRKSGSAGMPRPISYAVFCLKKKTDSHRWCSWVVESAVNEGMRGLRMRRRGVNSSISNIFFFNDTATTEIYTLSLHAALPI